MVSLTLKTSVYCNSSTYSTYRLAHIRRNEVILIFYYSRWQIPSFTGLGTTLPNEGPNDGMGSN